MIRFYVGQTDDGHEYGRAWAFCDGCKVEGEPAIGLPEEETKLRALAAAKAGIDQSGSCDRCRSTAAAGGVL